MYGEYIYVTQFPASGLDAQLLIVADSPCMVALSACSQSPLSGHSLSCVIHPMIPSDASCDIAPGRTPQGHVECC